MIKNPITTRNSDIISVRTERRSGAGHTLRHDTGKGFPMRPKSTPLTMQCEYCGADFVQRNRYRIKHGLGRFCSRRCASHHQRDRLAALDPQQRFWDYVNKDGGPDACWLWEGPMGGRGYGFVAFSFPGKTTHVASRVAWEFANGPVPDGLFVCHTCDNRQCCNPAHLFLGTNADNMRDMVRKGRAANTKLTWDDVREIRRIGTHYGSYAECRELAKEFGVGHETIRRVLWFTTWKHDPEDAA